MLCHVDRSRVAARTAIALVCILAGGAWTTAFAQQRGQPPEEQTAAPTSVMIGPLTLQATFIDTENEGLSVGSTPVTAFSARTVNCPAAYTNGCTIKVEVSSQFWYISPGSVASIAVSIGSLPVNPSSEVNVDSTTSGHLASAHTFQWIAGSVPAGTSQTVSIAFIAQPAGNTVQAGFRTATVEVFRN